MNRRALTFLGVGAIGFVVQTGLLALLIEWHWSLALSTMVAVESAIIVNYLGHERWTWRDRQAAGSDRPRRFVRFHLGNGLTSIVGNVVLTAAFAKGLGVHPVIANVLAVATLAVFNFMTADRWVFVRPLAVTGAALLLTSSVVAAAEPSPAALAAWSQHVNAVEREIESQPRRPALKEPVGHRIGVSDGSIHEWRGSVVVRNTTVEQVVNRLSDPCSLPPQEDVAKVRLLHRDGDRLRVYMRLVRKMIVTAVYDTEHAVAYTRHSPAHATSRSISTSIVEDGGDDRGFLWRLNSYWHYRQVGADVQIDVLSLSLSRDVPWMLKPIAPPIIERVGRESMMRTLHSVFEATDRGDSRERTDSNHTAC